MTLNDFDYELPPGLIAQRPLAERDASRMMVIDRRAGTFQDKNFREIQAILRPGDLLVLNNTRVFPARLLGRRRGIRSQTIGKNNPAARENLTGETEVFLSHREGEDAWQALVHPGRKVRVGEIIVFGDEELEAVVLDRGEFGLRRVRLKASRGSVDEAIDRLGHVPLPPYIRRPDGVQDRETYQTVYARVRGAVAAPTAGLHFTAQLLEGLRARGVCTCAITLHVGLGTFQPVRAERVEEHRMEREWFEVRQSSAQAIQEARNEGRRIIAVGTTSARTLEHVARENTGKVVASRGETGLFIYPGFEFQVVQGLVTNFHLPKSTLLMLVCAFAGKDLILRSYQHAIQERYRFYSYGDCMLIV